MIERLVVTDLGHQFELDKVGFCVRRPPNLEFIFGIKFFDLYTVSIYSILPKDKENKDAN